jgi:type III restriction enzyme
MFPSNTKVGLFHLIVSLRRRSVPRMIFRTWSMASFKRVIEVPEPRVDLRTLRHRFRLQRLVFRLAAEIVKAYDRPWLFPQAVRIVQRVIEEKVTYGPGVDHRELCNLRYVSHLKERIGAALRPAEGEATLLPVLDEYEPIGSTDRLAFTTSKLCEATTRSHISHAVCDSGLEQSIARGLERHPRVVAYAKNDRLFLEIPYRFLGRTLRYRPDFLVRLDSGANLLLEGKGKADEKDDAKATAARRWISAVNAWGKLGAWRHDICYEEASLAGILAHAADER